MAGFFDLTDPENAALLGLASGFLQAGAPSRLPVPLGVAFARGLQDAVNAQLGRRLAQGPVTNTLTRAAGAQPFMIPGHVFGRNR